jgi:hypothetical protein
MTSTLNYLEAVEQHFQSARGSAFFRLSPLDWALVEAWQSAGIPLDAVFRGIDRTFENWRRIPRARTEKVNSIAYCTQMIAAEAQAMANATHIASSRGTAPFPIAQVREFVIRNASTVREKGFADFAAELESLDLQALYSDLERLEQRLTAIEEKMIARLRKSASEEILFQARHALDRDLTPYRGKMTPDQLAMLEKQFLGRRLLESAGLPRLSLFYL